jgi:hypothetical protein
MLLLLRLLLLRCHIRLRSAILELIHPLLIATGHVVLVLVRVAIEARWLAVLPHCRTLLSDMTGYDVQYFHTASTQITSV